MALIGASPAREVFHDGDDVAGRLDLRLVSVSKKQAPSRKALVVRVETFERWRSKVLREHGSIGIDLTTDRDPKIERVIDVEFSDEKGLSAEVWATGSGSTLGYAKVSQPNRRSLRIVFPLRWVGRRSARIGVSVGSSFDRPGSECHSPQVPGGCPDSAPDDGYFRVEI